MGHPVRGEGRNITTQQSMRELADEVKQREPGPPGRRAKSAPLIALAFTSNLWHRCVSNFGVPNLC
jgi:hypothetical protein